MVSGRCLEDVWRVSGRCLEDVLMVSRRSLEGVWRVSGRCLEGLIFQWRKLVPDKTMTLLWNFFLLVWIFFLQFENRNLDASRFYISNWKMKNMDVSGLPYSLGKFHIRTCPDFHISIENFKSGHVRISITDTSVFQLRTSPDFNFSIAKFQIRTRPDFNSGHVRISNFQLRNFRSGHVRISIPDFRFSRGFANIWGNFSLLIIHVHPKWFGSSLLARMVLQACLPCLRLFSCLLGGSSKG